MVFKYRSMSFPVDAQTVGNELEDIEKRRGVIDPPTVVNEARSASSPLHPCFEWRDGLAAEKWREQQARTLIGQLVRVSVSPAEPETRAFVSVVVSPTLTSPAQRKYVTIENAMSDADFTQQTINQALSELKYFEQKYKHLKVFQKMFQAINQMTKAIRSGTPLSAVTANTPAIDDPDLDEENADAVQPTGGVSDEQGKETVQPADSQRTVQRRVRGKNSDQAGADAQPQLCP